MDRKDFLAKLLPGKQALNTIEQPKKKQDKKNEPLRRSSELVLNSGLAPYAGSWTKSEVIHLLKRLTFGAPKEEVDYFSTLTYTQAVDLLLNTVNPNPGEPLKHYTPSTLTPSNDGDWGVAVGKSWVNNISSDGGVNFSRR